jgi:hypothetical protein
MVLLTGIEPVWCCHRGILSPLRLPISPQQRGMHGTLKNNTVLIINLTINAAACQLRFPLFRRAAFVV